MFKYRIKMVKLSDGKIKYYPQFRVYFFWWKNIGCDGKLYHKIQSVLSRDDAMRYIRKHCTDKKIYEIKEVEYEKIPM